MKFYTVRDLKTSFKNICDSLPENGEVVITNNNKPIALMINVSDENFEETMRAIKQVRAMILINNMRKKVIASGFMTDDEINGEIISARENKGV